MIEAKTAREITHSVLEKQNRRDSEYFHKVVKPAIDEKIRESALVGGSCIRYWFNEAEHYKGALNSMRKFITNYYSALGYECYNSVSANSVGEFKISW